MKNSFNTTELWIGSGRTVIDARRISVPMARHPNDVDEIVKWEEVDRDRPFRIPNLPVEFEDDGFHLNQFEGE